MVRDDKTCTARSNLNRLEASLSRMAALFHGSGMAVPEVMAQIREKKHELTGLVESGTDIWKGIRIARHPQRPVLEDYLEVIVHDFVELHGDKCFGDDPAVVTGLGRIGRYRVLIVGHNKGKTLRQKYRCRHGCALPEGYRKAMAKMKMAEKFGLPVVCMIDTPGAHPGIEAEERGQAYAIACNLREMSRLHVPVIGVVIGEGGSGGALGIGVCDRLGMMEHAYYSVASPEACAAILWRDRAKAAVAARALRITSNDVLWLGWCDEIISEPQGGAHCDAKQAMQNVNRFILHRLRELTALDIDVLIERRYDRLRNYGRDFFRRRPKRLTDE